MASIYSLARDFDTTYATVRDALSIPLWIRDEDDMGMSIDATARKILTSALAPREAKPGRYHPLSCLTCNYEGAACGAHTGSDRGY